MRLRMMLFLGLSAGTLLLSSFASAQEPWPERREEWHERCRMLRERIADDKHLERRHRDEGARHEAHEDHERLGHDRHEFREHRCSEILRH
jgi:hypothetical protein